MNARILVVDDEESVRITLGANLELEGFDVFEAHDVASALETLRTQPVDLVLTDIKMPGETGVELLRKIHQTQPKLPVILMTAFTTEEIVLDGLCAGAFTVLPKPFDIEKVVTTLKRAATAPIVLVVDDQETDAKSLVDALCAAGVRATAAFGGAEALGKVRAGGIDVVVVDLVMPEMSGAEVAAQLLTSDVRVIAMSGHSVPEMMQSVAKTGAFVCMRKPFEPTELIRIIAKARTVR